MARQPLWSQVARVSGHAWLRLPRRGDTETQLLAHAARECGSEGSGYVELVFPVGPFPPPCGGLANTEQVGHSSNRGTWRPTSSQGGWPGRREACEHVLACVHGRVPVPAGSAEARREGSSPPVARGGPLRSQVTLGYLGLDFPSEEPGNPPPCQPFSPA